MTYFAPLNSSTVSVSLLVNGARLVSSQSPSTCFTDTSSGLLKVTFSTLSMLSSISRASNSFERVISLSPAML